MKIRYLFLGLLIAGACLYFTFRDVPFRDIYQSLQDFNYIYLPAAIFFYALFFIFRAYRWHYLCRTVKVIPPRRFYSPIMIGFMANLMSSRIGEFIRAYLLGNREKITFSASFATVVVDRLFDLIVLLAFFTGLLILNPTVFVPQGSESSAQIAAAVKTSGIGSLVLCVGLIIFCYLLVHKKEFTYRLVDFFTRFLPDKLKLRIDDILSSFSSGLGILQDPKGILLSIILSALIWGSMLMVNYPFYYCYGIESLLPFSSLVTMLVVCGAAVAVMPTPGYLGPFQLSVTFVLADIYGIDKGIAVSFSLVTWFLQTLAVVSSGLFFMVRDNESIFKLSKTAKAAADRNTEAETFGS